MTPVMCTNHRFDKLITASWSDALAAGPYIDVHNLVLLCENVLLLRI